MAETESLFRSHDSLLSLIDSVDGIVFEADPRTCAFLFVSEQAERLLGYPIDRWTREPTFWVDHIHPDDRDQTLRLCREATDRLERHEMEYRMIARDGRVVWLRSIVTVTGDMGEPERARGVMVDITKRREAELEVEAMRAQLATYQSLVSHDLGNFALTLSGLVDRLEEAAGGDLPPEQHELLRRIARQGHEMSRLAANARLLERIGAGDLPAAGDLPLAETVQRVVDVVRGLHFDKRVSITESCPEHLRVSGVPFFENVLLNLLDNAVRHSERGSEARVGIDAFEQNGSVLIAIRGGRPQRDGQLERLFLRYVRGDGSNGTGLGLALVREIVQSAGGSVSAANVDDQFQVTLSLPR